MKEKIALFDLDGTLLNTNNLILESFKYTFKKHLNLEIRESELLPHFGEPLSVTLSHYGKDLADEMLVTYRKFNAKKHDELTSVFPNVEATLKELKANGYKIGLVTSKLTSIAVHGLELFHLRKYFDCIVGSGDTKEHKPHPGPVLKAINSLCDEYQVAFMVGDTPYDILAARAAGITPIGVSWSVRIDELKQLKPYMIIDDLTDLIVEFCGDGELDDFTKSVGSKG